MNNEGLKKTAILAGIYGAVAVGSIFYRAATKNIIIVDAAIELDEENIDGEKYNLHVSNDTTGTQAGTFRIPLASDVSSTSITVDDRYTDGELLIYINSRDENFYKENSILYNDVSLTKAECLEMSDDAVCLNFGVDGLSEKTVELSERCIIVSVAETSEKYENIVVIDPLCGGTDTGYVSGDLQEKDINMKVAAYVYDYFKDSDDIKIFLTRTRDEQTSVEKREQIIERSGADFLVEISTDSFEENTDISGFNVYYNDVYFIREFGNFELAKSLFNNIYMTDSVTPGEIQGQSQCDDVLKNSKIPSAVVSAGCLTNEQDRENLSDDEYLKAVAEGVARGIEEAFEITNPEEEETE